MALLVLHRRDQSGSRDEADHAHQQSLLDDEADDGAVRRADQLERRDLASARATCRAPSEPYLQVPQSRMSDDSTADREGLRLERERAVAALAQESLP